MTEAPELRRFALVHDADPSYRAQMLVRPDGKYVLHKDAADLLAAAEAERDAAKAKVVGLIDYPTEPGGFPGDIWFGHPENRTMGTHRWTGAKWVTLQTDFEACSALLETARAERDAARAELTKAREMLSRAHDAWNAGLHKRWDAEDRAAQKDATP
jgi:hypothetical protein